jgi:hypothetical protein
VIKGALYLAVLAGCAQLPDALRDPSKAEQQALEQTVETWNAWREPASCEALDRAMIAIVPHDELQTWCAGNGSTLGCVLVAQRYVGEQPRAVIFASDTLDDNGIASVIIHEALHILRACWIYDAREDWDEYSSRMNRGETASCEIHYRADHWHCDLGIWTGIEFEAYARWLEAQP